MSTDVPRDRYNGVWLIFFMLGLGTLLPWNFVMTATMYFTSRLRDPSLARAAANETAASGEERSALESSFNNTMTLCAMLPLLAFTCLNSFLLPLVSQRLRVMGSLLIIMVVFSITAIMVKVHMDPLTFFSVTMVKIVIMNSFGAVLQGSLFGMAGPLPASYTTPIMSGQGLAGTFAALAMICALASGAGLHDAAFGYFITACVVVLMSILSYLVLNKLEFYQFHQSIISDGRQPEPENTLSLMKKESSTEPEPAENQRNGSMLDIFMKIWPLALSVCCTFTVTIGLFPAVAVDTKSTLAGGGAWEVYFIPVSCFLLFNVSDWAGRSLTAVVMWPARDSRLLPVCVALRLLFVPLFLLCNVQPRSHLPAFFLHDAWFLAFMALFAFSNGYLASLCMCYGPKKVAPREAETAGSIMAFFLSLGLALGAAMSFVFRKLI